MSRKIKRTVASTLALAMMAGSVNAMPAVQFSSIVQAAGTGATVSAKVAEGSSATVKPGEKITIVCDVTNNDEGFSALVAWMSYNKTAFKYESFEKGSWTANAGTKGDYLSKPKPEKQDLVYQNPDANIGTLISLFSDQDGENLKGSLDLYSVTFTVLDTAADGEYEFSIGGDPVLQDGKKTADQNRTSGDKDNRVVEELEVNYQSVKVKVAKDASTPAETTPAPAETTPAPAETTPAPAETTPAPAETTPAPATSAPAQTMPADEDPDPSRIQISAEKNVEAKAGETVKLTISAKNVGAGFSTVQFDYDMNESFTVVSAKTAGDIDGGWKVGTESRALQFLEADGMNVEEDGPICIVEISIPEGTADGTYPIILSAFEGSSFNGAKQDTLKADSFQGFAGSIVVSGGSAAVTTPAPSKTPEETSAPDVTPSKAPSYQQPVSEGQIAGAAKGPKVDAGKYEVKAGETFKIKVKVTDNTAGINGINTWLDIDTDVFEIIADKKGKPTKGDADAAEKASYSDDLSVNYFNKEGGAANITTALALFSGSANVTGDMVLSTITLKVKDNVKPGVYALPFDAVADGGDMANRLDADKNPIVLNPTYYGALVAVDTKLTDDEPAETTPAPAETTPAPETTPAGDIDGDDEAPENAIQIIVEKGVKAKAGETVKVMISAKNVGEGFSTVQFDYDMDKNFKIVSAKTAGDIDGGWKIGTESRALQFLEADGMNVEEDGPICELEISIPEGTADGTYPIKLSGFEGSSFDGTKQKTLKGEDFWGVAGSIVIGDAAPETTPAETTPAETTPAETTPAPVETTPAPVETTPAPVETTPAPAETTPAPVETTPAPVETTPAPVEDLTGDVDDNGVVNARDLVALKRFLLLAEKEVPKNGDLNGDKAINAMDLIHLIKILMK